jgi:hypothetical protein
MYIPFSQVYPTTPGPTLGNLHFQSYQLGAQVIKTSKKSRSRERRNQARDMYRQASGCPIRCNGDYKTTLRSGKIVTGGKINIVCWSAVSRGTTQTSAQRSLTLHPPPITRIQNPVIIEDSAKGVYNPNVRIRRKPPSQNTMK